MHPYYDWIKPEDVIRHALAAFYAECRAIDRFEATEAEGPPDATTGRPAFVTNVADDLRDRLNQQALSAGLPGFHPSPYFERRQADDQDGQP